MASIQYNKYLVLITSDLKQHVELSSIPQNKEHICRYSVGIIFRNDKNIYILTTLHGVNDANNIVIYYRNDNNKNKNNNDNNNNNNDNNSKSTVDSYKGIIVAAFDELDICLITINEDIDNILIDSSYLMDSLEVLDNININYIDIDKFIINKEIDVKELKCNNKEISYERIDSLNMPLVSTYKIMIENDTFESIEKLQGLSGSPLIYDDKILGILINVNTKTKQFQVISSAIILRLIREVFETGKFKGLCNIIADISFCEFSNDNNNNNNNNQYGLSVENNYNIDYNQINTTKSNPQIKINDIIVGIDNNKILENGNIYDNVFKCLMPYSSFIALHYKEGDKMKIDLLREIKENDHDEKTIEINARSVNSAKYIPKFGITREILNCNGINFMMLSENILDIYMNNNMIMTNDILKNYKDAPYRNSEKYIVFINNINRDMIPKKTLIKIDKYKLPLKIENNKYMIPIVTQIDNKKKVTSMELLKSYIRDKQDYTIYVKYDKNTLKLIFKNGLIEDIKV